MRPGRFCRSALAGAKRFAGRACKGAPTLLLVFATSGVPAADQQQALAPPPSVYDAVSQFVRLLEILQKEYSDPSVIQSNAHIVAAMRAYVRSVDPDADLLSPEQLREKQRADTENKPHELAPAMMFLTKGIAFCRLREISVPAVETLRAQIKQAESGHARGIIVDIRDNAGGTLDAAVAAAQIFLPARAEIVTLGYSNPEHRATFVSENRKHCSMPVVLLVNSGTAVEAELFAAALRDHKRARLIGSKTAGRGRLSSLFPLSDGFALYLPAAYYLPPAKRPFHKIGLTPDVSVEPAGETDAALAKALELFK
jgi:hypothetical protein